MDTIFRPVFDGTMYKHHLCENCGYKLKVGQSVWGGVSFDSASEIKFCPKCGSPVARFENKPIYEKSIDFEPMRIFYEENEKFERKLRWIFYCKLSEAEQQKINKLMPFAENETGWTKIAFNAVRKATRWGIDWRARKKLETEFRGEQDGMDKR